MHWDGGIETIDERVVIGTGEPVGRFFLNKYWRPDMNIEQVAELGYFIIKVNLEFILFPMINLTMQPRINFWNNVK